MKISDRLWKNFPLLILLAWAVPAFAGGSAPIEMPVPSALAEKYYRHGNLIWVFAVLWGIGVPALFLLTGWAGKWRKISWAIGKRWYYSLLVFFTGYTIYAFVLDLPLAYYAGFRREHLYHLSNQLFSKWLSDYFTELGLILVMGGIVLWFPYWFLKKSPRRWWAITGLAALPYFCFVMLVQPIWIAPLFNHFGRMEDRALETKILALAHRAGIDSDRVYQVNKSVDTRRMNAYVTGFLGTKRIVLWDTTLQDLDDEEILSIMGHEMGHYVLHHVVEGILVTWVLTLIGLFLIHRTAGWAIRRYSARWGFDELADFASLPLIILLIQIFSFVLTPIGLAYSRHIEHEADRFGLEINQDGNAMMRTEIAFVQKDLGYPWPDRWVVLLRYGHPPDGERFEFGRDYRPWEKGEPLKYGRYFSPR